MEEVCCPLCGAVAARSLWRKRDACYVECLSCDLVYENPRFTAQEIAAFYSRESYYVKNRDVAPGSGYLDYFAQCSQVLVEEYFRILQRVAPRRDPIRLLDVGCGPGGLVRAAQEHGWVAAGLEISSWAVETGHRQGLNIALGTLDEVSFGAGSFDVVSMFDVLEHLPLPVSSVAEIHRILAPEGVVVAETPNVAGFFARYLYKEDSDIVEPRAHVCLYSPTTAGRLFKECGFLKMDIRTFPYCRRYTPGYFKSLLVTRMNPRLPKRQLTYNESMRIVAWK